MQVPTEDLRDVSPVLLAKLASSFSSKDLEQPTAAMTFLKSIADQAGKDSQKEKKENKKKRRRRTKKIRRTRKKMVQRQQRQRRQAQRLRHSP